ncbi:MAG TPA: beta-galactosidase GalA [Candidatus Acidoferrum sp.]|nr:beta-galactosidase GalA [Candidatus Acidoferrum sp.]
MHAITPFRPVFRPLALSFAGLALGLLVSCSCAPSGTATGSKPSLRQRTLLDADWRFHRGDMLPSDEVIQPSYDDSQWQRVDLPHDYVLDETGHYSPTNDRSHGYLTYEPAWYRKQFVIPEADAGKALRLEFDGVFRDAQVWLNGHYLGGHPSGYTPFQFNINKAARCGAENVITVRVDPRKFEGWWYEGGGIYRHVWFTAKNPVHIGTWGTHVISDLPWDNPTADAALTIETRITNDSDNPAQCEIVSEILGPNGAKVAMLKEAKEVPARRERELAQQTVIQGPRLWSLEQPQLYTLKTTLLCDGKPVDATTTPFGIRTIHYDAEKGFFLNGKHVELNGVACHQDFAGVGIAVPDSLQEWRVRQLKQMGCNAWRTAHNPPSTALLDACDRLGMLVMDENRHLGDCYSHHSPKGTTYTNLTDLSVMILRDRNHPSIIMWSMCNEEGLQGTDEGAKIFSAMMDVVHRYDRTRPVTCAMNAGWLKPGIADVEDIIGINYNPQRYDAIHERHPQKPMFGSEDTNDKTTRGEYADDKTNGLRSCYNLSEKDWLPVIRRPFVCGSFTWTGFDYRGEPNPYGWPDVSNNTGLLDLCGFPKDKRYYFQSCWSDKPMVHVLPDGWNWPGKEGQPIRVLAFSNGGEVELFLNGKSLGRQTMPKDAHVEWQVPYAPGKLVAKAYTNGKLVATDTVETTGAPARIVLSPERKVLRADGEDAVVVPVSVVDAEGRVVPITDNRISFEIAVQGRILGVSNGDPSDHDSDRANNRKAFHGRCIAVIGAGPKPGTIELTATSPGLKPATASFRVK